MTSTLTSRRHSDSAPDHPSFASNALSSLVCAPATAKTSSPVTWDSLENAPEVDVPSVSWLTANTPFFGSNTADAAGLAHTQRASPSISIRARTKGSALDLIPMPRGKAGGTSLRDISNLFSCTYKGRPIGVEGGMGNGSKVNMETKQELR